MSGATTYLANRLLDHTLRGVTYTPPAAVYLALFTTPTTAAGGGDEVVGGSYARQLVAFTVADLASIQNNDVETFTNMPGGDVVAFGIMDAAAGGNMLFYGAVDPVRTTVAGENLLVQAGELIASFTV